MRGHFSSLTFDYWCYCPVKNEEDNYMLLPRTALLSPQTKQNSDNCNEAHSSLLEGRSVRGIWMTWMNVSRRWA